MEWLVVCPALGLEILRSARGFGIRGTDQGFVVRGLAQGSRVRGPAWESAFLFFRYANEKDIEQKLRLTILLDKNNCSFM